MVLIRSRHDAPRMRINSYPEDVVRKVGMGMLAGFPAIVHETHRFFDKFKVSDQPRTDRMNDLPKRKILVFFSEFPVKCRSGSQDALGVPLA